MSNIAFQYPIWFVALCVLAGLLYATALYFRSKALKDQPKWLIMALAFLRFSAVTIICLLLLSPLLKSLVTEAKKPVVVLAQDLSESILHDMSDEDSLAYVQKIQVLEAKLSEQYELQTFSFGEEVKEGIDYQFDDKVTNISKLFTEIYDRYTGQNLGAVIIATDGIYNEGSNPIYNSAKLAAPVFPIALGDTVPDKDLIVKRVFHNKIAYLDDKFSLQIDIDARNCNNAPVNLIVFKVTDGKTEKLKTLPITIDRTQFFSTQEIVLDADQPGVQRYRISLTSVKGEVSTSNNTKDVFIEVLDARQKILILANAPHPDISAIKTSILKNKNYQVDIAYANESVGVAAYDFVILHQLPSLTNAAEGFLQTLYDRNIPRLYIVGSQSDVNRMSKVQPLINAKVGTASTNDVQAVVNTGFNLFTLDSEMTRELPKFNPLISPFAEYSATAEAEVLLWQKIGSVETKYPLLSFGEVNKIKVGVLTAEGLWRWRLFDFMQRQNHNVFDELISKTVTYLTLKEDKRKFRISLAKNIYNENEPILLDAELYNDSYELINDPDAALTITNEGGKNFNYTFNKVNKAYSLNTGFFPPGNYNYKGLVNHNGEQLTHEGRFSVRPVQLEKFETTADHGMLRILANQFGGQLVFPSELDSLPSIIAGKDEVKPVLYSNLKTRSVINLKWIFWLLIALLGVEWFTRRYKGSY
ncbi:MAG: hypothetical protein ACI94Y_001707 [Maribacter sp.]